MIDQGVGVAEVNNADMLMGMSLADLLSSGGSLAYYTDTDKYLSTVIGNTPTTINSNVAANVIYVAPVFVPAARTFTSIVAYLTVNGSGNALLGIYDCDENFKPTVPLYSSGLISLAALGLKTASFSLDLSGRPYFIAFWASAITNWTQWNSTGPTMGIRMTSAGFQQNIASLTYNQSSLTTLPDLTGVTPSGFGNYASLLPVMGLR